MTNPGYPDLSQIPDSFPGNFNLPGMKTYREKKVVCLHEMTRDCETVIQLVMEDMERATFQSIILTEVLDGVSSHLGLPRGRKFSRLAPSHDESEIRYKAKFA